MPACCLGWCWLGVSLVVLLAWFPSLIEFVWDCWLFGCWGVDGWLGLLVGGFGLCVL